IEPLPAILTFTIYADQSNINQALIPASKGYVGVLAYSRGKGLSHDAVAPYRYEHKDVYAVIDWISKQPWNNGKVGMFGGSYNGFAQWASIKDSVHLALKTIVPCVSAAPGIDVPMENNIFHNFSYKWISYVTENKYLYNADYQRWENLQNKWFHAGAPYNKMDSIDGTPNPLFHEWISHPDYDSYWQGMIPYKDEFAHIDIPILTITGYYDDGQRGAMYYYNQHLKYNPDAMHYLIIGPWDHWGAQSTPGANLRGYQLDEAAQIDIQNQLIFDWFDYILKGKGKPDILKDKVNFEVMGKNKWLHTPALADMSNDSLVYYLSANRSGDMYQLSTKANKDPDDLNLTINLADRSIPNNADFYPWPIMKDSINLRDGLVFETDPFEKEVIMNGSFTGKLQLSANKKDFDYSINLYELTAEGKYFHLSYYIGRASYSKSKEKRELLTPNKETTISFDNTRIISKKISKGSRLVVIVNGNKNPYAQINYGTGRDVSNESIKDATIPLELKFNSASKIVIPIINNAEDQNAKNFAAMLDTIWRTEQEPIRMRDSIGKVHGFESEEFQKQNEIYHRNHDINECKILKILDTYGWPDRDMAGNHGNLTICNVIQHADNEVRLKYLPLMRQAVEDKKLEPRYFGRAEDRIATERGDLQIFGTQIKYYPKTKTFDVWPVFDPANVNKRRADIGLGPIEEFLKNRFSLEWNVVDQIKRSEEFENK
ncbi:MAG TPA: CocE/NonD family hydrolase, partial [Bacteroidales bacterium]|nr:CocE/NonD family hydrolase [Bacteroidales bacterium]